MRYITRDHLFEHRLNLVQKSWKFYHIFHEGSRADTRVPRTAALDVAFAAENWDAFVAAEAKALHGEVTA